MKLRFATYKAVSHNAPANPITPSLLPEKPRLFIGRHLIKHPYERQVEGYQRIFKNANFLFNTAILTVQDIDVITDYFCFS
ncbi:hypothetical protein ABC383_06130 [Noviherbaspirillum sp. 1P10PC]|uniref:hypothetical protein n=1 Tax=Noviherbaspirillum sp. 1P10PC TaxID=3132292 RepID=UPI0039A1C67F